MSQRADEPTRRIRVKFCGMTDAQDAARAAALGADALGMVFFPPAQTAVSEAEARAVARAAPPLVSRVALFVNPRESEVAAAIAAARPHCLQFHGEESPAFCAGFGIPYIKAFRIRGAEDIRRARDAHPDASGILLDSFSEKVPGGSGESFGWELARDFSRPFILAGGLTAENVGAAISSCRPWAVDVSSGTAVAGNRRRKDFVKMRAFMEAVNHATATGTTVGG